MKKRIIIGILSAVIMMTAIIGPVIVQAKRVENTPYLALGADLSDEQRAVVLELLDVDTSNMDIYTITEVTNAQEHEYLGSYLDASVIGSRSLSSVKVTGREDGYGIQIRTENITYCTEGMYQNALATAGVEDADVVVVAPVPISGTAALVGAMKAYETMTGKVIKPELADGATNELVVTGKLAEVLGDSDKAEEFIAAVKEVISANEFETEDDILKAIEDIAADLDIELSDEDKAMILSLMQKLSKLDLDFDKIKEQAGELYNRISNMDLSQYGITEERVQSFWEELSSFFTDLFSKIKEMI